MNVSNHRRRLSEAVARRPARRLPRLLRVDDWRVRTKLGAVLTIPAVAFLVVAGLQTTSSVQEATTLQQFSRQAQLARQVTVLVHELQRERDHTAGVMAGIGDTGRPASNDPAHLAAELAPDEAAVDQAANALRDAAQPLTDDPVVRVLYQHAAESLQGLRDVRAGVLSGWLRQRAVFDAYSRSINDLLTLLPAPAGAAGDPQLTEAVRVFTDLARAKELTAQIRGRLFAVATVGRFAPQEFDLFADIRAQQQAAFDKYRTDATPEQIARYNDTVRGQAVRNAGRLEDTAIDRAHSGEVGIDPQQWWQASTTQLELIRQVEADLLGQAVTAATNRSTAQWRGTLLATALIIMIMVIASLTSWAIGRSMARSLRTLRDQALDVAQHRLPEALERLRTTPRGDPLIEMASAAVHTTDEIGEVAEAFTAVHRSAVRLAVEQAMMRRAVNAMFVNLARRSQTLVERQLQLLDGLEAAETDPEQLANLFRLDHLATRMRRNDENLLVLAGSDASRRWPEPVALSSVVLAAMAEIEQYPRIRHDVTDDVYVAGHAVADVVHLLAELLENATTFSPPDTLVTMTGWRSSDDSGATLLIKDSGLGMTPAGVAEANQRLASPTAIDVAASERMGLVVVGHLAARHRIRVELRGSSEGVMAQVWVPRELLAQPPVHRAAILTGRPVHDGDARSVGRLSTVIRRPVASIGAGPTAATPATATLPGSAEVTAEIISISEPGDGRSAVRPADARPGASPPSQRGAPADDTPMPRSGPPTPAAPTPAAPAAAAPTRPVSPAAQVTGEAPAASPSGPAGAPDAAAARPAGTGESPASTGEPSPAGSAQSAPAEPPPPKPNPVIGRAPRPAARPGVADAGTNGAAPARTGAVRGLGAGRGGTGPRRTTPTRAEDVLGASQPEPGGTRWWSRSATPAEPSAPVRPVPTPVSGGTSEAGLPIRVPMAQLPGQQATRRGDDEPTRPIAEPDPSQLGSTLSQFYSGVHRATAEERPDS